MSTFDAMRKHPIHALPPRAITSSGSSGCGGMRRASACLVWLSAKTLLPSFLDNARATGTHSRSKAKNGGSTMAWNKPVVTEIALGAEINSYACAELSR